MKGQSSLIGHTIAFALSIGLISALVVALSSVQTNYREFTIDHEIGNVCNMVKNSVEKIYWPSSYMPINTTMGRIVIELPEKIGDIGYEARFDNTSLKVEMNELAINRSCEMGFNISFSGRTDGGRTVIKWLAESKNKIIMEREI
ncbi:MAG: hypothetical protein HZB66_00200 [Candidatus Aenigmarchaeota archaeon]|nr:hypothetical protein [Candidatus Aenigmarchaeota archaeon]